MDASKRLQSKNNLYQPMININTLWINSKGEIKNELQKNYNYFNIIIGPVSGCRFGN